MSLVLSRRLTVLGLGGLTGALALTACGGAPPPASAPATSAAAPSSYSVLTPAGKSDRRRPDLGDLPGDADARPDPGLRLPREHRRPAAVRLAAAPEAGHVDRQRPGLGDQPLPDRDRLHDQRQREVLGRLAGHRRRCRLQPAARGRPQGRRLLRRQLRPGQDDRPPPATRPSPSRSSSRTNGSWASCPPPPARSWRRSTSRPRARRSARSPAAPCAPGRSSSPPGRPARASRSSPTRTTGTPACPSRSSRA